MINYLKLQFDYLFSRLFSLCFVLLIIGSFVGIIITSNIDMGFSYLDAFINEYQIDYYHESLLIIEIVSVILAIFVSAHLGSKNNDFLVSYTCNNYFDKIAFYISRSLVAVFFSLLYVLSIGIFLLGYTLVVTPFYLDIEFVVNGLVSVFFISIYFSGFTLILLSFINHFILVSLPLILFWYLKTIYDFKALESDVQELLLKLFPVFLIDYELVYYQDFYIYVFIYLGMQGIITVLNVFKEF